MAHDPHCADRMRNTFTCAILLILACAGCTQRDAGGQDRTAAVPQDASAGANEPPPAASFDSAYRAAHRGTIRVQIPEVYELVNIAIALTATGRADSGLVVQHTPYHTALRSWFEPHSSHPAILQLDSVLRTQPGRYFTLKMNGYAFEFDAGGRIIPSAVYDRTGFAGEPRNTLVPFIPALQAFSDASDFRAFHRRHAAFYARQVAFLRDTVDIPGMQAWLERNFPGRAPYDAYNVIFSPLVGWNQSMTSFESNGFRELQPHVNFPYPEALARRGLDILSDRSRTLYRGNILFTELNHGYINAEGDRYAARISRALADRGRWAEAGSPSDHYPGRWLFDEYMNWVLVSLRLAELAPPAERRPLLDAVDAAMLRRGFPQFPALSAFLVPRYLEGAPTRPLADLYPEIVAWFERGGR